MTSQQMKTPRGFETSKEIIEAKYSAADAELLVRHGGFLFDGLRLDAAQDWRKTTE